MKTAISTEKNSLIDVIINHRAIPKKESGAIVFEPGMTGKAKHTHKCDYVTIYELRKGRPHLVEIHSDTILSIAEKIKEINNLETIEDIDPKDDLPF